MKTCEVEGCSDYAARQLCPRHGKDVRQGRLTAEPHWYTQPNPPCEVEGCDRCSESRKTPLICHVHKGHYREGRNVESVRRKSRHGSQKGATCQERECERPAHSKGLCQNHYSKQRTKYKWGLCTYPGCGVRTAKDECVAHRPPREPNPLKEVNCEIPGCHKTFRTLGNTICAHHRTVLRKKGLTLVQFLSLSEISECQACGYPKRLVVDHVHGHHTRDDEMCPECIRGRLCNHCNTALGLVSDSVARLRQLVTYLETHPPGVVLP